MYKLREVMYELVRKRCLQLKSPSDKIQITEKFTMKYFMFLLSLCSYALANGIDFKSHFAINGKEISGMQHAMIKPNTPTLIEVYFTDPRTGDVYKDFKVMHGKYMHMVVASKDLGVFKHVHPYFDPITGRFAITLNMPYADPDNFDTHAALRTPGMYMVMTDVIVAGVGMRMDHAMVHVMGQSNTVTLNPDPMNSDQSITKYFKRDDEAIPTYKTIFSYNTIAGCSGNIVNFEIEVFKHNGTEYIEMLDFEPWLSEAAHSVWLSEGYMSHMMHNMPFAHMHSPFFMDDDDDDTNDRVYDHILRFNFHDQKQMLDGVQKMWIQFKDNGKVMKLPFIFNYNAADLSGC